VQLADQRRRQARGEEAQCRCDRERCLLRRKVGAPRDGDDQFVHHGNMVPAPGCKASVRRKLARMARTLFDNPRVAQ
jgi:hypothetical protein